MTFNKPPPGIFTIWDPVWSIVPLKMVVPPDPAMSRLTACGFWQRRNWKLWLSNVSLELFHTQVRVSQELVGC